MTDRDKLIEELREFFTYIDEDRQDIITKAIAALSAPEKAAIGATMKGESKP